MPAFNEEAPAEALPEAVEAAEAAPVSADPEPVESSQAAPAEPEATQERTPYLKPDPAEPRENEFAVRERELRAQGWLPPSERPAGYDGPILAGELVEPLFAAKAEPAARTWADFDPAYDQHPADHPARLPPAARPCKAGA